MALKTKEPMKAQTYAGFVVLAAMGIGMVLLVQSRPGTAVRHTDKEWNELSAKVERLERTTARLQKELDETRKSFPTFTSQPADILKLPAGMNPTVSPTGVPPGSTPFVFNGITYYVTPLAQAR